MQSLNFLFWNTNRKPLVREIANIAHHHNIDIILLAEHNLNNVELLLALNAEQTDYQSPNPIFQSKRILEYLTINTQTIYLYFLL